MIVYLLNLGIALTPFAMLKGMDFRTPKEIVAMVCALSVGMLAIYLGKLKPFKNYWVLLFIVFMYVSIAFAPALPEYMLAVKHGKSFNILFNRPMAQAWMGQAAFFILTYLLLMITVASIDFTKKQISNIIFIMALCGLLSSLYIFMQAAHLDQFFNVKVTEVNVTKAHIGGFLGQPTIVSPFISMIIPIALYLRRYIWAILMAVAVVLTASKVAITAMIVGVIAYLLISRQITYRRIIIGKVIGILLLIAVISGSFWWAHDKTIDDIYSYVNLESQGRFATWRKIIDHFQKKRFGKMHTLTGIGPGSFRYDFSLSRDNGFWQAHNDPLEALINFGIAGISFIVMGFYYMIRKLNKMRNELIIALGSSIFIVLLSSCGTFPFQIPTTIFYSVVILGLLHNRAIGGYYAQTQ